MTWAIANMGLDGRYGSCSSQASYDMVRHIQWPAEAGCVACDSAAVAGSDDRGPPTDPFVCESNTITLVAALHTVKVLRKVTMAVTWLWLPWLS